MKVTSAPLFERVAPESLKGFNEKTKICTMNCGPHKDDPRDAKERKFLCDDCIFTEERSE